MDKDRTDHRSAGMTSKHPLPAELRIILVGRVGAGRTTTMNNILGARGERETMVPVSHHTDKCEKKQNHINGQKVVVVDTPGLGQPQQSDESVMKEIKRSFKLVSPGPHAFLYLQRVRAITDSEAAAMTLFKSFFRQEILQYTLVVFTHAEGKPINNELISTNQALKDFVSQCQGGYCVLDSEDQDPSQVDELLAKVNQMVQKNQQRNQGFLTEKEVDLRRRISLAVSGSAVVGAGCGAGVSHFVWSVLGMTAGIVGGGIVGAALGAGGILVYEHMKDKLKG